MEKRERDKEWKWGKKRMKVRGKETKRGEKKKERGIESCEWKEKKK